MKVKILNFELQIKCQKSAQNCTELKLTACDINNGKASHIWNLLKIEITISMHLLDENDILFAKNSSRCDGKMREYWFVWFKTLHYGKRVWER